MTHSGRDSLSCCVRCWPAFRRRMLANVLLLSSLLATGCTSADVFRAGEIPAWLQAPTIENAKTLDLSRLATGSYTNDAIDRGDVLEVTIISGLNAKDIAPIPARVNDAGNITIPYVGDIPVQGLEPEVAEAAIATACIQRGVYRSPVVTVTMKRQRTNRVLVVGAVKNSGVHYLPRGSSDLLSALVAAGSLADDAGTSVEIRNPPSSGGTTPDRIAGGLGSFGNIAQTGHSQNIPAAAARPAQSVRVDLVSATKGGNVAYSLEDGAIVMVERRDPLPIHVLGLVQKPGRYEYPVSSELRVLDAVALANGVSNKAANKVYVIRKLPGQTQPSVIEVSMRAAKKSGAENLKLAPGDIVSVEQTPSTILIDAIMLIRFGVGASLGTFF